MIFLQGICFVTNEKYIEDCRGEWEKLTNNAIVEYLVVPRLPRDASVEWQMWAHKHNTAFECKIKLFTVILHCSN
jgi:diphthine-ammonia ligase